MHKNIFSVKYMICYTTYNDISSLLYKDLSSKIKLLKHLKEIIGYLRNI